MCSGSYNQRPIMVHLPLDKLFSPTISPFYTALELYQSLAIPNTTNNSPYDIFPSSILALILCSNTPYTKDLKKNIWNICISVGSMSGFKQTHRLWFLAPSRHL